MVPSSVHHYDELLNSGGFRRIRSLRAIFLCLLLKLTRLNQLEQLSPEILRRISQKINPRRKKKLLF
jgi:hypothetical protein